ncbi:hypothetical protein Taro_017177 [Colocasia esculenta]|uniref:Uncharacterized protein n=1 Tax=Colocasia esculenta TaxID=4460 RepID=A0A843UQQ1_COLES|nr:hypothetical protein [Colocasia esculenta]
MYEWYDGSVYMITYTYGTYIGIRCAWFLHVLEFWPKARLASISVDVDVVSASTLWTPTLSPTSSDVDANFSDQHVLQSPEFREQASSPIGELSPMALSLSHHHSGVPKPLCFKPTPPAPERALLGSLQRGEKTLASREKSWTLQARIQQCEGVSGVLLQQGGSWNIGEGFPNRDRNLASMPLTPRSLVCVQRSCRPLLERPETAAKRGGAPAREDEPRCDERAEQQAPAPQGLAQVPAQDHGGPSTMERFKRMLPPSFKGESDPLLAESWMREIEKIFRAIRCADEDKVTLATYMLQEGDVEQYLEEMKASQKRPAATFQRQDKKKAVYPTQQRSVAVGSSQVPSVHSPGVKKECPHCGETHGGTECWMITEFWPKARLASISTDVDVVSVSTIWTPTLTPASSDVDANFSDLHALQSPEFWEQASSPIGELSPTELGVNALDAEIPGVVGDDTLAEEAVETDSERGD